jgi:hypothetical protein
MRDGKLHGVVAQSTFLDVEMFKSTRRSWCQAHVQVKMSKTKKHHMSGPLLDVHDTTTTTTATSTTTTTTTLQLHVQLQLQLHYATLITLQIQLQQLYTSPITLHQLHYNYQ